MSLPQEFCTILFSRPRARLLALAVLLVWAPIARADTLTATPSNLAFGNVPVRSRSTLPVVLSNPGNRTVSITRKQIKGSPFSISNIKLPIVLDPGQTYTVNVTFNPRSAGYFSGEVIGYGPSGRVVDVPLSGTGVTGGTLSPNPASLDFGSVQVGQNRTLYETLTNTGGSDVTISSDTLTGVGFSVSGLNPPIVLPAGQNYTFSVTFAPQSTGNANGNLTITSNASNPNLGIPLSGTGTAAGQLSVTPASLDFGKVVIGTKSSLSATLTASGAAVTVTSATLSNSQFTLSGLTFPFTIQAGGNAGFTVTFTPQGSGVANGTLTFTSDASNSPTTQNLTGTGTAPPQYNVMLNWSASQSQDVVGYNVYRGNASGGPYSKINLSLDQDTTYNDTSVTNGQTYYYVSRAVDSQNQESANSNETEAVIPQ